MRKIYLLIMLLFSMKTVYAQDITNDHYIVRDGNGKGIVWGANEFKMHMGNLSEYKYGPVTDMSIKVNMSNHTTRGWTWGVSGQTPIAALNTQGKFQIANDFITLGRLGVGTNLPASNAHFIFNRPETSFGNTSSYLILSNISITQKNISGIVFASNAQGAGTSLITAQHNRDEKNSGRLTFYTRNLSGNLNTALVLDENGNLTAGGDITLNGGKTLHSNRGKLTFSHVLSDFNHSIYNNYNNIDGQGAWDGMKFNVYNGAWFRTGDHKTPQTALYINESGKIGINTKNPGADHLAVNGNIKAHQVKVSIEGWSDFVFEEDYKLRSLQEVEEFIKENKHLPEIPSAKEVEKDGVNLGSMDALLLQKIEELTLYMIELKKENEEMKNEIKLLQTQVLD